MDSNKLTGVRSSRGALERPHRDHRSSSRASLICAWDPSIMIRTVTSDGSCSRSLSRWTVVTPRSRGELGVGTGMVLATRPKSSRKITRRELLPRGNLGPLRLALATNCARSVRSCPSTLARADADAAIRRAGTGPS